MGAISNTISATIAEGAALSGAVFLGEKSLVSIQMPAAWTAADLTFQVSDDRGVTWTELRDDGGTAIQYAVAAGERRDVAAGTFASCLFLKVRSGTSGAAVNQDAARTLTLITRKLYPTG